MTRLPRSHPVVDRSATSPATTQIFCASTLYGAATLAAALDSGCFAPAGRRLLLVANNAATPETAVPLDRMPGFERLRGRFDAVLSWNDAIAPFHPGGWSPRPDDVPLWERYLRLLWELGDDRVELVVESLQVAPALSIVQLFQDAPIDVYADGLMSYGPTRNRLDPLIGERVRRLLHLDLVPGLRPLLLGEFGTVPVVVPTEAFTKVVDELASAEEEPQAAGPPGAALLLGQYLSALGILSPAEEEALHVRMVRGAVARGHRRLLFKPHPVAPASWQRTLEREAEGLGAELTVLERPVLAEVLFGRLRPGLVAGCFSTALFTASTFYGIPAARIGTGPLLDRLTPYQNSNRVPVTLADALLPDLESPPGAVPGPEAIPEHAGTDPAGEEPAGEDPAGLIGAVGFAMQPRIRPDLRPVAERYLAGRPARLTRRYFKLRRLTALGLPGGVPVPRNAVVRRAVRHARRIKRAALTPRRRG
ncbi:polysialyltransferase family glycosyltransferase [Streptomyces sp. SP18CS02]|uniref:polysialyltransferase family glycosyltransferase n=1 Tax=Streptomyces sp. SP18CS02 TaxID=3002531 RepID=UPI002E78FCFD|nr:polysialyltransferase family glycosyltransferase [Streptomyces sp. SP18CS02]MEE1756186.1 polysialyltransferase family glycosyltransferase [Streptomyces sp. SP18CS02]